MSTVIQMPDGSFAIKKSKVFDSISFFNSIKSDAARRLPEGNHTEDNENHMLELSGIRESPSNLVFTLLD